jgi:hypothetical protein
MNNAEVLVDKLCKRTFLSLWSYPSPLNRDNKELCDMLVVCEPDVLIFSVKEIQIKKTGDDELNRQRWHRRAVEESAEQIYGAERFLTTVGAFTTREGQMALPIPALEVRRIYRIAVALGGQGKVPIMSGDFGKGFVHVLEDNSLEIIMHELDTITDFVQYLKDKEALVEEQQEIIIEGGEGDLLALYLTNARKFPPANGFKISGLWDDFRSRIEYHDRRTADNVSYSWDRLIESFYDDFIKNNLETPMSLANIERSIRVMAKESRFYRRALAKAFIEFIDLASEAKKEIESRMLLSPSGIIYVFLAKPHGYDRQARAAELGLRCFIARGKSNAEIVIGIATEQYRPNYGHSFEFCYLFQKSWTDEDSEKALEMQRDLGYFEKPNEYKRHFEEYPPREAGKSECGENEK